jgi:hypothetical protein
MSDAAIVMATFGGIFGFLATLFLSSIVFGALGLWLGGKLVSAPQGGITNALVASLGSTVASFVLGSMLSIVPFVGSALGYLLGLAASVFIVQSIFKTDGLKSSLCVVLEMVFGWVGFFLVVVTFAGGIGVIAVLFGN